MKPAGFSLVAGHEETGEGSVWTALRPATRERIEPEYRDLSPAKVDSAVSAARSAVDSAIYSPGTVAETLRAIADALDQNAEPLIDRADIETALGRPRLEGELARTSFQFRLMAEEITSVHRDPVVDPDPEPLIRAAVPLGVVAVFAASNFPLAFGVAGTDTAAALAAGCAVVAKAHPAQPGTAELLGKVVSNALSAAGLDPGFFSVIHESGYERGLQLTTHPDVDAVAFTGSRNGGMALVRAAESRERPIPVYAEMGSFNPVLVTSNAAAERGPEIAAQLIESYQLGAGQFCTKPGLVLLPYTEAGESMRKAFIDQVMEAPGCALLTDSISNSFESGLERISSIDGTSIHRPDSPEGQTSPAVVETTPETLASDETMLQELFGPVTILTLVARDQAELVISRLEPALTTTVYFQPDETEYVRSLVDTLSRISGRVIANGVPTGVRVSPAMHHGGPYPATSSPLHTSVGTAAIDRFLRPVSLQGFDTETLPIWAQPRGKETNRA